MHKKILLYSLSFLLASHVIAFAYDRDYDDNYDYSCNKKCSDRIRKLEEEIAILKDRLNRKDNCPQTTQIITPSAETWICKYEGFSNAQYTGIGASKAVADQRASDKCKSQDKSDGFFCKFASCSQ